MRDVVLVKVGVLQYLHCYVPFLGIYYERKDFSSLEEAIEIANDVKFGLSAWTFTNKIQKKLYFIEDMEARLVRVNAESAGVELQAPFGEMKQSSSHSREQGQAAIEFYTSIKTVFVKGT